MYVMNIQHWEIISAFKFCVFDDVLPCIIEVSVVICYHATWSSIYSYVEG